MTYNLQRKIKFTIARYIMHERVKKMCTWEKTEKQKRELKMLQIT